MNSLTFHGANQNIFCFLGRLDIAQKGIDLLLQSYDTVKDKYEFLW